jgi:MGT family glycosyltransferase
MATVLAYTSPALGHMLPISALLVELSQRGHAVHLKTLSTCQALGRELGFAADPIDPRIEALEHDDWMAGSPPAAIKRAFAVFGRRAELEVADLTEAVDRVRPDALLVDINCWGALSAAEAGSVPWACFSPFTPLLRAPGVPPFGPGLKPMPNLFGRARDALVRTAMRGPLGSGLPMLNGVRRELHLPEVGSLDEFWRRGPLMLVASGKPFEYERADWGDRVQMIGPCPLEPDAEVPDWLKSIDRPIVLVTTSSEKQNDADLVHTAVRALADEPVHVVATLPAGGAEGVDARAHVTVCRMVPHGPVLDRAVCAVTHGGMGATQKALARGLPVCVVPHGRDQFEVARRVEVARCGTRLPAKKLSADRLRSKVREAMSMGAGAKRVAAGFAATGGVARGADLFEQRTLGRSAR